MRSPLLPLILCVVVTGCSESDEMELLPCDNQTQACDPDDPDDLEEHAAILPPAPEELPEAAPVDRFGVRKIYPTVSGGREWTLPNDAESANSEWSPSNGNRGKMVKTGSA